MKKVFFILTKFLIILISIFIIMAIHQKQFNIKTVDELRDTPLRQFTGFLINADLGREKFWKIHGQAYVAKVQFLMNTTEDNAQRYNHKRRLEDVMGKRTELAVWNNVILKNSGFI